MAKSRSSPSLIFASRSWGYAQPGKSRLIFEFTESLLIGLGAASLTKFLYRYRPRAKITSTSGHGAAEAIGAGPASGAIAADNVAAATPSRRAGVMVGWDTLSGPPRSLAVG